MEFDGDILSLEARKLENKFIVTTKSNHVIELSFSRMKDMCNAMNDPNFQSGKAQFARTPCGPCSAVKETK
jgi:hypothetical protein